MPIQVFGNGAVQTAYVNYLPLDLTDGSITLIWPTSYVDVPYTADGINYNILAASMTVITPLSNTATITLPDATMSTVGANFIITNIGQSAFNLLKADGSLLINIPNYAFSPDIVITNSYWVQLIDNSTVAGKWQSVAYGAGTSYAQSGDLAGSGLIALNAELNTQIVVQSKDTNYTVTSSDRATMIVWRGGTGTITLPNMGSISPGFYLSFNNGGTGTLTIQGDALIDGASNILISPNQSLSVTSGDTAWWTLGFGQNILSSLFVNGNAANPSISFLNDNTTGFFYTSPYILSASANGVPVLSISPTGLDLAVPLSIVSGGTEASTAADAIIALMPRSITGALAYFDGANWVTLPPGTNGRVLTMVDEIPTWV